MVLWVGQVGDLANVFRSRVPHKCGPRGVAGMAKAAREQKNHTEHKHKGDPHVERCAAHSLVRRSGKAPGAHVANSDGSVMSQ